MHIIYILVSKHFNSNAFICIFFSVSWFWIRHTLWLCFQSEFKYLNFSDNERMETSLKGFSHQSRSILLIWPGKFFWNIIQKEKCFSQMENGSGAKSLHLSTRLLERFFHPFRSDKLYKIVHRSGQSLLIFHSILARVTHILTNPGKGFTYFNQSRQGFHIFSLILARVSHIFTNPGKGYTYFH